MVSTREERFPTRGYVGFNGQVFILGYFNAISSRFRHLTCSIPLGLTEKAAAEAKREAITASFIVISTTTEEQNVPTSITHAKIVQIAVGKSAESNGRVKQGTKMSFQRFTEGYARAFTNHPR